VDGRTCLDSAPAVACAAQVHKVKPETLKSILSLARTADSCTTPAVVGGMRHADVETSGVTSHGRETGSDDTSRDAATGERSSSSSGDSPAVDDSESQISAQRSGIESFDPSSQDKQMRLATEGQSVLPLRAGSRLGLRMTWSGP